MSDGAAVAGVTVVRGALRTETDGSGGFAWDTAEEGPVDVRLGATDAVTDLSCASPHRIAVSDDEPVGSARIAMLVRGVTAVAPTFAAHYTRVVAEGREERVSVQPAVVLQPTPSSEGGRAWALHLDVPPADRWALGLVTLAPTSGGEAVDQIVLLSGEDLRDGDVAAYDLFLSDETLRGWLAWDLSGPPGVSSVELVETLALGDLPVAVTTWRGPVRQPRLVPLVQRTATTLPASIEGRFTYPPAGDCVSRTVHSLALWSPALGDDPAGTLRFQPPWPSPPMVERRGEDVVLSGFPRDDVAVSWRTSRWMGLGTGLCGAFTLTPPVATVGGVLSWSDVDSGGACTLSPSWRVAPP